jgi:hypothetical protein
LALVLFGFSPFSVCAATRYVDVNSASPTPPYATWATAATNIQDAVDAAVAGDEIVVTNGRYATGGQMDPNGDYRCVVVDKPLTLQSVNGPQATVIDGGSAVGCVYLTNGATLFGFTLTNGVAGWEGGGGVYCESTNAVLSNCVLSGNSAYGGGGACGGTLNNCTLTGSIATGFASFFQWVPGDGGGALFGTLNNCTLIGNSAEYGGGAAYSTLNNCTLTGNSAYDGGGVYGDSDSPCTLNNCIVYFNSDASPFGGNNYDPSSALNYCCTTPMPTTGVGNISADPQLASASHLSAESPCIGAGSATYASGTDIDGEPWANPPSIGCDEYHAGAVTGPLTVAISGDYTNVATGFSVGLTAFIAGRTDLSVWDFGDGLVQVNEPYTSHAWTAPGDYVVALWAYNESYPGGVSATLTIHVVEGVYYVAATSGNPVAPYTSWATAATNIQGAVDAASVPGAVVLVTNGTYAPVEVNNPLVLRSVNGPYVTIISGGGPCVYLADNAVLVGFTLTNGFTYAYGGGVSCESSSAVVSNCVLTGNSGGGAYRGTLNNCTLANNSAGAYTVYGVAYGGGAYGCTLNNCTLTGNSAPATGNNGGYGGGAHSCTLNNCTLIGNSASCGGGAYNCTLNNCTLTGNSDGAVDCTLNNCVVSRNTGGGAYGDGIGPCTLNNCTVTANSGCGVEYANLNNCTVTGNSGYGGWWGVNFNNCIVYFNSDTNGPYTTLNYCCTTPMPTNGVGNITNAPLFVDYAGGNLRLQSNSPCINSGNNAYVVGSTDLDGNPRIVCGTVDIGAYEYQTPTSIISYAWLQQYGLPTDGSADFTDPDRDGMNNWQEWIAGTDPTDASSVLKMTSATPTNNPAGLVVTWESVNTRTYYLQSSTNLAAQPAFSAIQSNIFGQAGTTSYTDTTATNAGPYFYRVGVGN